MEIHIEDNKPLEEIKNEFSRRYPFLKIEFFQHAHKEGSGSPKSDMIDGNPALGEVRQKHNEGGVVINENMSVSDLEGNFENKYGIHIQVFRKSGDLWLETSATDSWTLKEQNDTGADME
ncbi:MAG: hypothetical protein RIC15_09690 [Vicingaceae bacterium]